MLITGVSPDILDLDHVLYCVPRKSLVAMSPGPPFLSLSFCLHLLSHSNFSSSSDFFFLFGGGRAEEDKVEFLNTGGWHRVALPPS